MAERSRGRARVDAQFVFTLGGFRGLDAAGRRRERVYEFGFAVDAVMRFHAKMPLVALHRLMHFRVALAFAVFGRTASA